VKRQELTTYLNALHYVYRAHVPVAYSADLGIHVASEIYVDADGQHATDDEVLLAFHVLFDASTEVVRGLRLDLGGCRPESDPETGLSPMHVMFDPEVIARIGRDVIETNTDHKSVPGRLDGRWLRERLYVVGQQTSRARQFAREELDRLGVTAPPKGR
jgi:hypothetical protein